MGTLANRESPDKMPRNVAFCLGLHFLPRSKQYPGTKVKYKLKCSTCDPINI